MNERLFIAAEAEVGGVIREAVARAAGDPRRALDLARRWADDRPERRRLLVWSVRRRVNSLPVIDEMVDGVFELVGGDEGAADSILDECLRSPLLRDRLDRQIAEVAAAALGEWVVSACETWRESHDR